MIQGPWDQQHAHQALVVQRFFLQQEEREKEHMRLGPLQSIGAPWPGIQSTAMSAVWRHIPHSALQCKDAHPSLPGTDIAAGGGQVPCSTRLSGTKKYTPSPAQGKICPSKESCPAQAVRALHVFARKCSRAQATPMWPCRVGASFRGLPFPTRKSKGQLPGL